MSVRKDLTGQTFERWTVLDRASNRGKCTFWRCQCFCGTIREVQTSNLISGGSLSCGCLRRDHAGLHLITHHKTKTPEFRIWQGIKTRCSNPHSKGFIHYGGRGITLCEHWQDFQHFLADMGPRPSAKHSIERRNNMLGYSAENCRWASRKEQARNTNRNRMVTIGEHTACVAEWLETFALPGHIFWGRVKRGWDIAQALTTPHDPSTQRPPRPYRNLITINGITHCLTEWLTLAHMGPSTYKQRIKRGWTSQQALSVPVRHQKKGISKTIDRSAISS